MEDTEQTQPNSENAETLVPGEQPRMEVEGLPEDAAELRSLLAEAQSKVNEYLDGWQRSRAEFANYKKRVESQRSQDYQNAAGSILKRYLEVMDDLELALNNRPAPGVEPDWATGIELVYRKLVSILDAEGVKPMQVVGEFFDPMRHEAVSHEESDTVEIGNVIASVRQGYMLGDRVLRPACVRVAK
jgi:molecular chaperone GrpE